MKHCKVSDVMTWEVVTIGPDETLDVAEQVMHAGRIHHLPVVSEGGRLVGLLTQADVLRAKVSVFAELSRAEEAEILRSIPVSKIMSTSLCTIEPEDTALHAAKLLTRFKYGCLPVVSHGRLAGIVTEGDFVELAMKALDVHVQPHRQAEELPHATGELSAVTVPQGSA